MTVTDPVREQLQSTLGDAYSIERELGGGGMSRVFLAEETRLGRDASSSRCCRPSSARGVSAERFEREIRLAARLQHPHIVPLLAAGDVDGLPYYTMPFVAGASLRERMTRRRRFRSHEAQGILRDVAKALAYAHRQGIVHRDIKPENVLLSEGTAMVADFGVARATQRRGDDRRSAARRLTQIGTQIGTPAYMAPEQAAGDPDVDFRADLYAFGVMAYELLAGQHPFAERKTAHALVVAHMTETPEQHHDARDDGVPVDGEHRHAVSRQGSARAARRARPTIVAALESGVGDAGAVSGARAQTPCRRLRRSPCCRSPT